MRLLEVLAREREAVAMTEMAARTRSAIERRQRGKERRLEVDADLARLAAGDVGPLLSSLLDCGGWRLTFDAEPDSGVEVPWASVRDAMREGSVPQALPTGWRLYCLSYEDALSWADYLTGAGWLLVTPESTHLAVPGEMGFTTGTWPTEADARAAILAAREKMEDEDA